MDAITLDSVVFIAIKGSLICAIAILAAAALRKGTAALRHSLWTVAVIAQLILPFAATVTPPRPLVVSLPRIAVAERTAATTTTSSPKKSAPQNSSIDPVKTIVLGGAAIVLLRLIAGTIILSRVSRRSQRVTDGNWLAEVQRRCAELSISRPVTLLWSDRVSVPVTWGFLYPVILLPDGAREWSDERRAHVLLHELAHVRRADALTQLLGQFAVALFWFNPLVWLAVRAMRSEAENACDDYVLRSGERPSRYATTLVRLVESQHGSDVPAFASLSAGSRSDLESRVAAITRPERNTSGRRIALAASVATMLLLVVPISAIQRAVDAVAPRERIECRPLTKIDFAFGEMSGTLTEDDGTSRYYFFLRPQPDRCVEASFPMGTQFTADDRDVLPMNGNALVREKTAEVDRAVFVTDEGRGREMRYLVDGRERSWDAPARRWYTALMPEVIRLTEAGAKERAQRILKEQGIDAFEVELDRIPSTSVRRDYLLAVAPSLSVERLMAMSEHLRKFEPELASFLATLISRDARTAPLAIKSAATFHSWADRATVINAMTKHRDPSIRLRGLEAIAEFPGDAWRRDLLENAAPFCIGAAERAEFLRLAATIKFAADREVVESALR